MCSRLVSSQRDVTLELGLTVRSHGLVTEVLLDLDRELTYLDIYPPACPII